MKLYKGNVLFEAQVEVCGNCYLVIYGRHINGYFCCIPDWNVGCEMAEPSDTYWNYESLRKTKLNKEAAKAIVREIAHIAAGVKPQSKTHIGEVVGEYSAPYLPVSEGYTDKENLTSCRSGKWSCGTISFSAFTVCLPSALTRFRRI